MVTAENITDEQIRAAQAPWIVAMHEDADEFNEATTWYRMSPQPIGVGVWTCDPVKAWHFHDESEARALAAEIQLRSPCPIVAERHGFAFDRARCAEILNARAKERP